MSRLIRGFRLSLVALLVLPCALWPLRDALGRLLLPSFLEFYPFGSEATQFAFHVDLIKLATLLLVFPFFAAEAWLLICERARSESARRYALPFALVSGAAQLGVLWLVRGIEPYISYVRPLAGS